MLKCPECNAEYAKATGLGRHRQTAHGIAGSSKTVKHSRKQITKRQKKGKNAIVSETPKHKETRSYTRKQEISNEEATVLITVGRITTICESIAASYHFSQSEFTKRCATIFYASQVRE